jgi:hypothetical protein
MAKIVRPIPDALIARQVIRFFPDVVLGTRMAQLSRPTRRRGRSARPELEHAMLFFRHFRGNGPLGLHGCQLRDILMLSSTLATLSHR